MLYMTMRPALLVTAILTVVSYSDGVFAITCYMCDTQRTGVTTAVPSTHQNSKACAHSDAASLSKFAVDCDTFQANFTSCESAFTFGHDGKTVVRTYRDCINAEGKAKVKIEDALCKLYSYPPGLQYVCACKGDKCNTENGVGSTSIPSHHLYGTVNGLSPALITAEIVAREEDLNKTKREDAIKEAAINLANATANVTKLTAEKAVLVEELVIKAATAVVAFNKVNASGEPKDRAALGKADAGKNAVDKALAGKLALIKEAEETERLTKYLWDWAVQAKKNADKAEADKVAAEKKTAEERFKAATGKIPGEPLNIFRQILDVALTEIQPIKTARQRHKINS